MQRPTAPIKRCSLAVSTLGDVRLQHVEPPGDPVMPTAASNAVLAQAAALDPALPS